MAQLVIPSNIAERVRLQLLIRSTVYVQYNAGGEAFMVNSAPLSKWVHHETEHHAS